MTFRLSILLAAATAGLAAPATAVPLAPGALTALPGTTAATDPTLAGTVLADTLVPFSGALDGNALAGTVQQRVVRSTLTGLLDFDWRVSVAAASAGDFYTFRVGKFGATITGGDWRPDGLGAVAPNSAFAFTGSNLGYVNFNFDNTVNAGEDTRFFFLKTDATHFAKTAFYDFANRGTSELTSTTVTYGPGGVPEPSVWAMTIIGFAAIGLAARRRGHQSLSTSC